MFNRSSDPNAFIFSLINHLNRLLKIKCENSLPATSTNRDFGPRFGLHELIISDESNTNMESFSSLGYCYIHPDNVNDSIEYNSILAGSENFQVDEIEVYTKN